jgi:hypothetical protein
MKRLKPAARKITTNLVHYWFIAGLIPKRYGYGLFDAKNSYDRKSLSITADVFNKWNRNVEARECARVFALDQPDGRTLPVLEVIFVGQKTLDRKFFGFLEIEGEYKIADVTSNL